MHEEFCNNRIGLASRRDMLKTLSAGFGYLAFAGIASAQDVVRTSALAAKVPPGNARAKRIIFLCMRGGPSHVDTFDYKPRLNQDHGTQSRFGTPWLGSPFKFQQHGQNGLYVSELFPEIAKQADKLCVLNGMHCDQPAHAQAFVQMHTGHFRVVRPSMGAWTLYGLGTENQNLPGFLSINPPTATGGAQNYGSAFLPAAYQGTRFMVQDSSQRNRRIDRMRRGEPNPHGIEDVINEQLTKSQQRRQLDLLRALDHEKLARDRHNPLLEGAIENYELAFRMQDSVPALMNLDGEDKATLEMYGIGAEPTDGFGRQCLLARRFAESGVRFIELGHGSWDQHNNMQQGLVENCTETDKPIAGLLADLDQRGLLDDTLILWGGEFGRTPYSPDANGRDHNHKGYTMWMAGGGVKGGFTYGSTDQHGYESVDGRVHIHDWHATILHLLGLDHEKLTYRHAGREMRLTDVAGRVVHEIVA